MELYYLHLIQSLEKASCEAQSIIQTIYGNQEAMIATTGDITTMDSQAEAIMNTIYGNGDYNGDGIPKSCLIRWH